MNGHAPALLTPKLRADGTSTLIPARPDDAVHAAAQRCTEPVNKKWHMVQGRTCGPWSYARGQRIPGTPDTFGLARCVRCEVRRDVVLPPDGKPLAGPEYWPMTEPPAS